MKMIMQTKEVEMINGVNVTQMGETVEAVQSDPTLAKFKFKWKK